MATVTSTLSAAIARNGGNPPRMTESGSDSARAGVSLQDQMRAMIQEALSGMLPALVAQSVPAQAVNAPSKGKGKATASLPTTVDPAGRWYMDGKTLEKKEKTTGRRYYNVADSSIVANSGVMIAKNNAREYGDVLILLKGKRKPLYLRASQFSALVEASGMLAKWLDSHQEYLVECLESAGSTEEKD